VIIGNMRDMKKKFLRQRLKELTANSGDLDLKFHGNKNN